MRISDVITGIAFAILGALIVVHAQGLPSLGGAVSAGLFPTIIGAVLAVSGATIAAKSLIASTVFPLFQVEEWMHDRRKLTAVLAIPIAIAAFAIFAPLIGTIAVSVLILAGLMLIWKERPLVVLLGSVIMAGLVYLLFFHLLRVPLPGAVIEGLMRW